MMHMPLFWSWIGVLVLIFGPELLDLFGDGEP